ncbi:MAG: M24 family metallopeptidase [Planctomycetes bacterium]|nr:M24 family metallopeptidase [Planctomycetota bacterium]
MKSTKTSSRRWPKHLAARLALLREKMRDHQLDGLLVVEPRDIRYLTGFSGEDAWALVTHHDVVIFSDHRFHEELIDLFAYARSIMRKNSLSEELGKVVGKKKLKAVGVQGEHLTLTQQKAVAKQIGAKAMKPVTGWLIEQRAVKDAPELVLIRKAIAIQEAAFLKLKKQIRVGMTERRIAAQLEFNMRSGGGDGPSFSTIVGAGPNSSINHYLPQNVKLKKNSPLLVDFGALYNGYHSDMTRVLVVGRFPKKIAEIYEIVRAAHAAAIDAIAPGKTCAEIDAVARNLIKKAGYDKQFRHGLGHGIGLEIHEQPRFGAKSKDVLEPGHVVTVEPGIYIPGLGGVRIEDDILVTDKGHRNLCSLPTTMESAMINAR